MATNTNNPSDPLGIISNPPSTFVKVVNTSREDMNGQFGLAVQYDVNRGRYMIQLVGGGSGGSESRMTALKPDNLMKASTIEGYQAQFQLLKNDPNIRRQVSQYYNLVASKLAPYKIKPEHAAGGMGVLVLAIIYMIGVSKMLMVFSTVLLLGMIVGPDIMAPNATPQSVAANFPRRCRETIEQSAPDFVRGRINNNVAAGIVILMVAFTLKTVVTPIGRPAAPVVPPVSSSSSGSNSGSIMTIDKAYQLGFDDATAGKTFGSSMTSTSDPDPTIYNDNFLDVPPPLPLLASSKSSSGFGLSQAMAIIYLYRTVTELGGNPMNGTFSVQRLMANAQTMEPWKMGILGFSLYNLVKGFL